MCRHLICLIVVVWGVLTMGGGRATVSASVLQGPQVLELMLGGSGDVKSLRVTQRLELFADDPDERPVELTETIRYLFPEKFRSDIQAPHIRRIHIVSGDSKLTVIDGEIAADPDSRFDSYKDVLLYRSRSLLQGRLVHSGVDMGVSSLGRFQGRVAFVIGARYPDLSVTQLWVEKDTFRPMRWLLASNNVDSPGTPLDIRYLDWQPIGGMWYPMRVEFHRGKRLLRSIHVADVRVDPTFADIDFDPAVLEAAHRSASRTDGDRHGRGVVNEIQQAIEEFKKIYKEE